MALTSAYRESGLFQCCIRAIMDDTEKEVESRTMKCDFCHAPLLFTHGAWQWNPDAVIDIDCIRASIERMPDD
jgi:hypothetical protein